MPRKKVCTPEEANPRACYPGKAAKGSRNEACMLAADGAR